MLEGVGSDTVLACGEGDAEVRCREEIEDCGVGQSSLAKVEGGGGGLEVSFSTSLTSCCILEWSVIKYNPWSVMFMLSRVSVSLVLVCEDKESSAKRSSFASIAVRHVVSRSRARSMILMLLLLEESVLGDWVMLLLCGGMIVQDSRIPLCSQRGR